MKKHPAPRSIGDDIPAFDRAMRGLIKVPKAELDAELKKAEKPKAPAKRTKKPRG